MTGLRHLDLITVRQQGPERHRGTLSAGETTMPCALGRSGITRSKREGDGATPAGTWPLRKVLYRPDRLQRPHTALAAHPLSPSDGWCDAPDDPSYNRPVQVPYGASAEALWREDALYDIVVVLGFNDNPPRAGLGSAIFFHLATPEFGPTEGCVAIACDEMIRLLAACGPATRFEIAG